MKPLDCCIVSLRLINSVANADTSGVDPMIMVIIMMILILLLLLLPKYDAMYSLISTDDSHDMQNNANVISSDPVIFRNWA